MAPIFESNEMDDLDWCCSRTVVCIRNAAVEINKQAALQRRQVGIKAMQNWSDRRQCQFNVNACCILSTITLAWKLAAYKIS